jgi:hypothetical protein
MSLQQSSRALPLPLVSVLFRKVVVTLHGRTVLRLRETFKLDLFQNRFWVKLLTHNAC